MNKDEALELKTAVESISIQQDLNKQDVLDVLVSTIQSELSEYFNLQEDDIHLNVDEECRVSAYRNYDVVDEVTDDSLEKTVEQARALDKNAKLGSRVREAINFQTLDRRNIRRLYSVLKQKLNNIHNEVLFKEYQGKEGGLVTGTFLRKYGRDIFLDIGKTEAKLPWREQSPREFFKQGDRVRCLLKKVELDENSRLSIVLSRKDPAFVHELFKIEVPEIADGVVKIKEIVREAGTKTKMSVYATRPGVEPVGACVGLSGMRIKNVIKELSGEKIDVVPFGSDVRVLLTRALQPAKVLNIFVISESEKEVMVEVEAESYPLAIGKGGFNIRLAQALTGWKIRLKSQEQLDKSTNDIRHILSNVQDKFRAMETDLHQLSDVVPEETLVKLLTNGITTVQELNDKNVLELARLPKMTEEEAQLVRRVLDEQVEVIYDEEELSRLKEEGQEYLDDLEDTLEETLEEVSAPTEETERYEEQLVVECPSCSKEFDFKNQTNCPHCGVGLEFDEEMG